MRRFLFTTIVVSLFLPRTALALDWEIERNFRYFLYPSDVAVQRVARDIYIEKHGSPPNAEQFEALINGPGFWTTKLGSVGDFRKNWPIDWPHDDATTPYQLLQKLRAEEDRVPPISADELGRRGWASLACSRTISWASAWRHADGIDGDLLEPNATIAHGLRRLGRLRAGAGMDRANL